MYQSSLLLDSTGRLPRWSSHGSTASSSGLGCRARGPIPPPAASAATRTRAGAVAATAVWRQRDRARQRGDQFPRSHDDEHGEEEPAEQEVALLAQVEPGVEQLLAGGHHHQLPGRAGGGERTTPPGRASRATAARARIVPTTTVEAARPDTSTLTQPASGLAERRDVASVRRQTLRAGTGDHERVHDELPQPGDGERHGRDRSSAGRRRAPSPSRARRAARPPGRRARSGSASTRRAARRPRGRRRRLVSTASPASHHAVAGPSEPMIPNTPSGRPSGKNRSGRKGPTGRSAGRSTRRALIRSPARR